MIERDPQWSVYGVGIIQQGNVLRAVDALGGVSARRVEGRWIDRFVPHYTAFMPEYALTSIQTESLVQDLSPYTTRIYGVPHRRYTHPRGGRPRPLSCVA